MNILHTVAEYHPSVGGMQEAVRQISEHLVKRGHSVTVATAKSVKRKEKHINGVKIIEFDIQGNAVDGYRGNVETYRNFIRSSNFDIITNFAAQQWATDLVLPILNQISAKKVLVPTGFSGLYLPKYAKYFAGMADILRQYDTCVFLSNDYRDIKFAKEHYVENLVVIPNGAAEDEFVGEPVVDLRRKLGIPADHFLIITVGSHTGLKGHAAAVSIFAKAEISKATFLIIGNEYWNGCGKLCRLKATIFNWLPNAKRTGKRLLVATLSREETVAAYKQADLFLFTSNIECSPIVLFECMASKTPFLSTDVGNAAEIIEWSGAGLLLPTTFTHRGYSKARVKECSVILKDVLADAASRENMQKDGYRSWEARFTWAEVSIRYENLYASLLGSKL